jgi:hypothetical protein
MTQRQQREQVAWDQRVQGVRLMQQPAMQWGCQGQPQMAQPGLFGLPQQMAQPQPQMVQLGLFGLSPQGAQPQPQMAQPGLCQHQSAMYCAAPQDETELGGIQGVISKQRFDGYWNLPLIGFEAIPWDQLPEIAAITDEKNRERTRHTVFALAMLEKSGGDKRVLWSLIREKAIEWLESQDSSINWNGVIAQVQSFMP